MLNAAAIAFADILSPPFRGVLWKSLALTIALLIALWVALEWMLANWIGTAWPWLNTAFEILAGIGLLIGLGFLVAPVAALFVGLLRRRHCRGCRACALP